MIQSDSGKYAVRAVAYIARQASRATPISAAEVAQAEGIPPYYLAKVLQDLAKVGVLVSVRGRGGGFLLARPPGEIFVVEVLGAVEDIERLRTECILGLDECHDEVGCPMHQTWKGYRERLLGLLEQMTVTDLVDAVELKLGAGNGNGAGIVG